MALIHIANIRNKDLNLLAVFLGIAEELNLSRAPGRLGLSQPALSHALSRLRDQFDDALITRSTAAAHNGKS
jgi:DNA-binding transcriptional LysR family regulator